MFKLIVRCNYISIPLISITSIIGYLASAFAGQRAIVGNSAHSYIADTIIITVDITSQSVNAICCTINQRCITIGALNTVQLNLHFCLFNGNAASSVIYKLIVTKLIAYQLRTCYNHVLFVFACVRSVAPALVSRILSVSFIAYACAVLQAYLIAVDDAVILQAYIAVYSQAILAAVGRAGVDVVQVNLLRIYLRIACGYLDIVVLGEVCYTISNNAVFSYVPLVIAFVVGLAIVVYKTTISDCIFVKAYSTFITVDKCVMILDAIARAIGEAGIAIGAYYVVQAYIKCSLLDRDIACCFVYQLVVAKLIAYQLRSCYSHVRLIGSGIRSVAVALVGCILSVSFVAYTCTVLQAYLIAVDDAVILQAHIAI